MEKLIAVEEAKALLTIAKDWSILKWPGGKTEGSYDLRSRSGPSTLAPVREYKVRVIPAEVCVGGRPAFYAHAGLVDELVSVQPVDVCYERLNLGA